MTITERFLNYTQFDTQSAEDSSTVPSTAKQLIFAEYLKKELQNEGFADVYLDEKGYLYATLKGNICTDAEGGCCDGNAKRVPVIGFIAHYDTSPDCSGANVKARIVEAYDGSDIVLSEGIISSPSKFPELLNHVGEDLIVTDGTTLLGADDKAGIAEIIQAMCYLRDHDEIKHGDIRIAFNPDEEIGMGAHHFDVERFGCEWAYTMDGGDLGELEYENFNAASAKIAVKGVSVHPGYAKNKMRNASRVAMELAAMLPADEVPEKTEGYEGFYHLINISGGCEKASLAYIIRDFDRDNFEKRKQYVTECVAKVNEKYGEGTVVAEIKDQYRNMREMVEPKQHILDIVKEAMKEIDVDVKVKPIRGGTDGAQLSFKNLPCPNLFTGMVNIHGPHEFISIQTMQKAMEMVIRICELTAKR